MRQPEPIENHIHEFQVAMYPYVGYLVISLFGIFVASVVVYIYKDELKDWYAGRKWKRNLEYRRLDEIFLHDLNKWGCIEYIDSKQVAITLYTIDPDGEVQGGLSQIFKCSELAKMHISRVKPHIGDQKKIPDWALELLKDKPAIHTPTK